MAVNKVIYGGNTLVDLTGDTVTAADLADGVRATGADGNPIVGLMQKVTIDAELSTSSTNPVQNKVITEALENVGEVASNADIDEALNLAGTGTIPSGGVVSIAQGGTGATTAAQARANLGAVAASDLSAVAKSGSYNDLTNKPTIPSMVNTTLTGSTSAETLTVSKTLNIPGGQIWIG